MSSLIAEEAVACMRRGRILRSVDPS